MHHELLRLRWATAAPDEGAWFFDGLDSLAQGQASRYERILPGQLALPTARGQSLELSADCFNLLNLLDRDWGLVRFTSGDSGGFAQTRLLELEGYDDAHGRGIYHLLAPTLREVDQAQSRWRLRLSARYTF
jgi:hypothetical protein